MDVKDYERMQRIYFKMFEELYCMLMSLFDTSVTSFFTCAGKNVIVKSMKMNLFYCLIFINNLTDQ